MDPDRFFDVFRRAATYVDKILKGAKPADLPVEQPSRTKVASWSSPQTRQALGITFPRRCLILADEVNPVTPSTSFLMHLLWKGMQKSSVNEPIE